MDEPKVWTLFKRKVQSRQRFHDEQSGHLDAAEWAMQADRFKSMGAARMGGRLQSTHRAHKGGKEDDEDGGKADQSKKDDKDVDESEDFFNKITASGVNQPEVVENSKEKEQGGGAQAAQSSPSAPRTQRAKTKAKRQNT